MEKVLADIDKVIIDKEAGSGVVPYFHFARIKKQRTNMKKIIIPIIAVIAATAFFQFLLLKR